MKGSPAVRAVAEEGVHRTDECSQPAAPAPGLPPPLMRVRASARSGTRREPRSAPESDSLVLVSKERPCPFPDSGRPFPEGVHRTPGHPVPEPTALFRVREVEVEPGGEGFCRIGRAISSAITTPTSAASGEKCPEALAHRVGVDVEHHHDEQEQHHDRARRRQAPEDRKELGTQQDPDARRLKNASTRNSAECTVLRAVMTRKPASSSTAAPTCSCSDWRSRR